VVQIGEREVQRPVTVKGRKTAREQFGYCAIARERQDFVFLAVFEDKDSADSYFFRGREARLSVPGSSVHPNLICKFTQNDPIVTQDPNVSQ
jgi:hypothetical protein